MKKNDLTGKKFGKLLVLYKSKEKKYNKLAWVCRCECDTIKIVDETGLKTGNTRSCGCLKTEKLKQRTTRHGKSKTSIHQIWKDIQDRCNNPNNSSYHNYGGRGIKVCNRWRGENGFQNFYEDIGRYREKGLTLERIENDGDYEPGNCRWATWQEQCNNKRARGYSWSKAAQKWSAYIRVNRKQIHLGLFNTQEEARQAYIEAKWRYHKVWLDE